MDHRADTTIYDVRELTTKWTDISPTNIPSHTAHRIESRGKIGEQGSQRRRAHSTSSETRLHRHIKGVSGDWNFWSGGIGARTLNPITASPFPAALLGPFVSFSATPHRGELDVTLRFFFAVPVGINLRLGASAENRKTTGTEAGGRGQAPPPQPKSGAPGA